MSNFDKLIKLISLDFADYPELDLRNQEIVRAQIENVRKFKIIRNRLYLAFVFFFALLSF